MWSIAALLCKSALLHTEGEISVEHINIFLSKYISKGAVNLTFLPDAGLPDYPSNPN